MRHKPKSATEVRNAQMRRIYYLVQCDGGETGLSQEELARKMGLSVKRIGKLLREMRTGPNKKEFSQMKKHTVNGKKHYYTEQPQASLLQVA